MNIDRSLDSLDVKCYIRRLKVVWMVYCITLLWCPILFKPIKCHTDARHFLEDKTAQEKGSAKIRAPAAKPNKNSYCLGKQAYREPQTVRR